MSEIEKKIAEGTGRAVALMDSIKQSRAELEALGASRKTINETETQARRLATNLGKLRKEMDAGRDGAEAAERILAAANGSTQGVHTSPTADDE